MDVKIEIQPSVEECCDAPTAESVMEDEIKTDMGEPKGEGQK